MSYDLNFWKYKNESALNNNHQMIYERLSNGEYIDELLEIPIDLILKKLKNVFLNQNWIFSDKVESCLQNIKGKGAFEIYTTSQFFRVTCYEMNGDQMNQLIDIALEFHLYLYDPQTGKRYD